VAHTNLRNTLVDLRKAIRDQEKRPRPLICSLPRETIQFNAASDCWIDVAAFRSVVARPWTGEGRAAERKTYTPLENALSLYRGPFWTILPVGNSSAWEEWCLQVREQLDREALECWSAWLIGTRSGASWSARSAWPGAG